MEIDLQKILQILETLSKTLEIIKAIGIIWDWLKERFKRPPE